MNFTTIRSLIILTHAFIGWGLCGAVMGIGLSLVSLETMLVIHAILAPVIFALVSMVYYKKFNYTTPLQTAMMFLLLVILLDYFVVALVINKSMEMFSSFLGTWVPFALIFLSTYITGLFLASDK